MIQDLQLNSCSQVSPAEVLSYLEHAEITFNQGAKQKAVTHHEVTQTRLANAGTWFEESLSFRSLQGEKVRRKLWKWWRINDWIKTGVQELGRGKAGLHLWPHKMTNETADSSLSLISQERPWNQSGQWPLWPLASAWATHSSRGSFYLV